MKRTAVISALVVAIATALLVLAAPALAQEIPFQSVALNNVSVLKPGTEGTFQYFVTHPTATQADCTLVILQRRGHRYAEMQRVPLGRQTVLNYTPPCDVPPADAVSSTVSIDLHRGNYTWYVSATVTVDGTEQTNSSYLTSGLHIGR